VSCGFLEGDVKRGLLALTLWVLWVGCAWAEDPVHFDDARLKAVVEAELCTSDPTPTDMLGLLHLMVPVLPDGKSTVLDLTGLEYATNLEWLSISASRISDLSPLSGLTSLRYLDAHASSTISSISDLAGLVNLEELALRENRISDISALSGMTKLEHVYLESNEIVDVSPLSGLTNLQGLHLQYNLITDVSPLLSLRGLQLLDLRGNPLSPEACTTYIPQIIANNPGVDVSYNPCSRHTVVLSSTAGGSITDPGEGEFTYDNGEAMFLRAQANPGFVFAGFSGTYSTPEGSIVLAVEQDHEIRANFVSLLGTIHVDNVSPGDPREDGTREHPFDRIQEAIEVAREGATIVVHAGTYRETIDLLGKSLTLTGLDPNDRGAGAWPVVDGNGAGPVVSFTQGEDPNCVLSGFVITAGQGQLAGAILCSCSSPTITNCLITGNRATDAAVYCADSNAVFANCTIASNNAGQSGAGLYLFDSHVNVVNSILWGNGAHEIAWAGVGGALVSYSDVKGGWKGPGCINADPLFAGTGDYHLQSQMGRWDPKGQTWVQDWATSPCIDAGDPGSPVGNEPLPNGGAVNMGAYGGTIEASKSYSDGPVYFADANLKAAVEEELYISDPTPIDMLALTQLIQLNYYIRNNAISDLTGLEYAVNLVDVNLPFHRIEDLSPLSGLSRLRTLGLLGNYVEDISPLSALRNLQALDLEQNKIVDISALSNLSNLAAVNLHRNFISDLSPLSGLTALRYVDVRANPLNDVAYVVYLPQIRANNPGVRLYNDAFFHGTLELSSTAGGSVVQPGEGRFTYGFYEEVVLQAQADPGYVFTGWSGTYSTSDNPLVLIMDQDHDITANFEPL
jgi:Leucine-rich repeat (LRR) protein